MKMQALWRTCVTAIIVMMLFISCRQQPPKNVEWSDLLITYIEARTDQGDGAGSFGDVIVQDVETGTQYRVTDDSFYDHSPAVSWDKRYVAFVSSRKGTSLSREFRGVSLPHELYLYDRRSNMTKEFSTKLLSGDWTASNGAFTCLTFTPDGGWLVAGTRGAEILRFSLDGLRADTFLVVPHAKYISRISFSPNGYLLGIDYSLDSLSLAAVSIYNEKDNTLRHIFTKPLQANMGGWHPNGTAMFFYEGNELYTYDYAQDTSIRNSRYDVAVEKSVGSFFVLSDTSALSEGKVYLGSDYTYQVFNYVPGDSLRWLTSGHGISDLSVYLPPLTGEKH